MVRARVALHPERRVALRRTSENPSITARSVAAACVENFRKRVRRHRYPIVFDTYDVMTSRSRRPKPKTRRVIARGNFDVEKVEIRNVSTDVTGPTVREATPVPADNDYPRLKKPNRSFRATAFVRQTGSVTPFNASALSPGTDRRLPGCSPGDFPGKNFRRPATVAPRDRRVPTTVSPFPGVGLDRR